MVKKGVWSDDEVDELKNLAAALLRTEEIAKRMDRPLGGIKHKMWQYKLYPHQIMASPFSDRAETKLAPRKKLVVVDDAPEPVHEPEVIEAFMWRPSDNPITLPPANECEWRDGDARDWKKCNVRKWNHTSWCREHWQRVYGKRVTE